MYNAILLQHEKFQSEPGSRVGTPAYLAPEVILTTRGKTYDGKVRPHFARLRVPLPSIIEHHRSPGHKLLCARATQLIVTFSTSHTELYTRHRESVRRKDNPKWTVDFLDQISYFQYKEKGSGSAGGCHWPLSKAMVSCRLQMSGHVESCCSSCWLQHIRLDGQRTSSSSPQRKCTSCCRLSPLQASMCTNLALL